ncbi:MAG: hypothetical protein K0Q94_5354 [Paenibacillus sp.]|nr:hypothetical protein [Paenibacillus sp.]
MRVWPQTDDLSGFFRYNFLNELEWGKHVSIYNNIFHYFRGQTSGRSGESPVLQLENNVTKAFLNVLEHADVSLFRSFCRELGVTPPSEKPEYHIQAASTFRQRSTLGAVLAIAREADVSTEGEPHSYTIADGAIVSPELALVLEVKIKDDRLYRSQLDGHKKLLAHSDQLASDPIVRTWEQIFGFLKQAKLTYESSGDALSGFLIGQFLDFSQTNCIAKDQLEAEDILRRFMTERERRMAGEIHRYILNHEAWKPNILISVPKRGDCIEYKLAGKQHRNFLTLLADDRVRGLIVRRDGEGGAALQTEIDRLTNIPFDRTGFHNGNEAYIRFDFWKDDWTGIRPFIDATGQYRL